MSKKKPYTSAEIALAKQLFAEAAAAGTLKPGRGLFAAAFSDGRRVTRSQEVTFQDYLEDARRDLEGGPEGHGPR